MLKKFLALNRSKQAEILLWGLMFGRILQIFLCSVWARFHIPDVFLFNDIIIIVLMFMSIREWKYRISTRNIITVVGLVLFYFLSGIFYADSAEYVREHGEAFIRAVLYIFVGLAIDVNKHKYWLHQISRIATVGFFLYITFMSSLANNPVDLEEENMYLAYLALPTTLFVIWQLLENLNIIDLVLSVVGSFLILSMGSRGPFVCIVFFVAAYLLFFKKYKRNALSKFLIAAAAALLYLFADSILLLLIGIVSRFGLNVRVLESLMSKNMFAAENSSGRDRIWTELIQAIMKDSTGFGYGLGGDERITSTGFEAHNVILAILISFGLILGGIILFLIIRYIFRAIKHTENTNQRVFLLLLFTVGFVKLLMSAIFIVDYYFFMLIGYSIALSNQKSGNLTKTNI